MNQELLSRLATCVTAVNASNKKTAKIEALKDFEDVSNLLCYTYDIFMPFRVTSKAIKKANGPAPSFEYADKPIYELLEDLTASKITGHAAISAVKGFIMSHPEFEELLYKVIDKDLKLGCNISTINKVFPKLIPTFEVSLGYPYADHKDKVTMDGQWFGSHKLDGIRCICIVKDDVKFYTRKGHEILTLDNLKPHIAALGVRDVVFDGELCIVDENDVEDFRAISKVWNKKNYTIEEPSYKMFDMLTVEEFDSQTSERILSERLEQLDATIPAGHKNLRTLEQIRLTEETFKTLQDEFRAKGWEGLILRKDVIYKGKRSQEILKMKDFSDAEFTVLSIEVDKFPKLIKGDGGDMLDFDGRGRCAFVDGKYYMSSEVIDGVEVGVGDVLGAVEYVDGLKTVEIEYKGNRVNVGSGFSLREREEFFADPSKIIGKTITVQYFEETANDNGTVSMRFPTLKAIHGRNRDA